MGHTILLQWSIAQPPANPTDIIITRLLEHYGLSQPIRTSTNFRTYRALFPSPSTPSETHSRLLTTITYSQPLAAVRDASGPAQPREDATYLFLEDRTPPSEIPASHPAPAESKPTANGQANDGEEIDVEGFVILSPPAPNADEPSDGAHAASDGSTGATGTSSLAKTPATLPAIAKGKRGVYRILAVRPSSNVLPLLQNLLSPLVMGVTKSARAAATTTAQTSSASPTPMPGTPLLLTSLTFPSLPQPHPPIRVVLHNLTSPAATTIFVEAEYLQRGSTIQYSRAILKEFLDSCIPDGVGGEKVFHQWDENEQDDTAWDGLERTRRATMLLARCLREGSYI